MSEFNAPEVEQSRFRWRAVAMAGLVVVCFGLIGARLYHLQVLRHDDLMAQAENNRTAVVPVVPTRGEIVDRNGLVMATNFSAYTVEITPADTRDGGGVDATIDAVAELIEISPRDRRVFKRLREDARSFDSLPLRSRLTDEEVARIAANRYRLPGVDVKVRLFRNYPFGEAGGHVVGYVGRINQREKERIEESEEAANYRGTEVIGKVGIEQSNETELHGVTGYEQLEKSAGGHAIRQLDSQPAITGDSLMLTVDMGLQKLVEDMYGKRRGALVALDPSNGEVLAFVSKPSYDPNLFIGGIDQESWAELNESVNRPLLNRALRGLYPPGSTYKPFMALAALETGTRKAGTVIQDGGSWTLSGHTFRSGHALGPVDLHRSIVKSSNVYYYSLAHEMGIDAMHDFMKPLGFGQLTGIDLVGESRGVLPSRAWKRSAFKRSQQQQWLPGETVSAGIGQGYNNFTILQVAHAMTILANGGVKHTPHLVKAKRSSHSNEFIDVQRPAGKQLPYQPEHLAAVLRGMLGVTLDGTSKRVFAGAGYSSGGKTGTAQAVTIGQKAKYNAAKLTEFQRDHSLYLAYAPADKPKIVVATIVENAGFGATAAAPLARRVFDYWLMGQYPSEADIAAVQRGAASSPIGLPRAVKDMVPRPPAELEAEAKAEAKAVAREKATPTANAPATAPEAAASATAQALPVSASSAPAVP